MSEATKNTLVFAAKGWTVVILIYISNLVVNKFTDYGFVGNFLIENPIIYFGWVSVLLACLFGYTEAWYWYFKGEKESKYNEHSFWTMARALVYFLVYRQLNDLAATIALCCMFPFFHDGTYYKTRNSIDYTYSKGWFDYSYTSTSKIDLLMKGFNRTLPGIIRTTLFVLSFAFLIYHYGRG